MNLTKKNLGRNSPQNQKKIYKHILRPIINYIKLYY